MKNLFPVFIPLGILLLLYFFILLGLLLLGLLILLYFVKVIGKLEENWGLTRWVICYFLLILRLLRKILRFLRVRVLSLWVEVLVFFHVYVSQNWEFEEKFDLYHFQLSWRFYRYHFYFQYSLYVLVFFLVFISQKWEFEETFDRYHFQ